MWGFLQHIHSKRITKYWPDKTVNKLKNLLLNQSLQTPKTGINLEWISNHIKCKKWRSHFIELSWWIFWLQCLIAISIYRSDDNDRGLWLWLIIFYNFFCQSFSFPYQVPSKRHSFAESVEEILYIIVNKGIEYSEYFTFVANIIIRVLLRKDPSQRLGGSERVTDDIKTQGFFWHINCRKIRRKIRAYFWI